MNAITSDLPRTATHFHSLSTLSTALDAGHCTSEGLVEHYLARIRRLDAKLHAWVDVYTDSALRSARASDQLREAGVRLGPLHGIPVAIKDLFEIEGHPITGGCAALPPRTSTHTATVVQRLRAAGAIVLGKTHTVEHAFGGWGTNAVMGTPWNPWDLHTHRVPGGSSSGSSVALAAGLCAAAIGTDTGGSVRIPAGLCGLVGLKTTHGLISRHGLLELCPTHDTVGPITRTVQDCARMLDVIAGPDASDPASLQSPVRRVADALEGGVDGLRVWTLPRSERADVDPEVLAACDAATLQLERLGARLVERPLPQSCAESMRIAGALMSAEGYASMGPLYRRDDLRFDPHVRRRVLGGQAISAADYLRLLQAKAAATEAMQQAMRDVDVCAFPTNPITAIPVGEVDELATPLSRFGRFVNLLDLCSVALPVGLSRAGLPISMQLVGGRFAEGTVLRAGHALQQVTDWHRRVPAGL